jgi:Asp-tRNA(Asn)/Glu-tRNA(Gln) amidotransferase A subunit family amidase
VVPFALGNDAGGSIRVPSSCCGAVGLFPTHTRIPSQTGTKHYKSTTLSDGPIAGTALDAALVYACIAGRTSGDSPGVCACNHRLFLLIVTHSASYLTGFGAFC